MPPEGWATQAVESLLAEHFAGEWGADPHSVPNAYVLRATNLNDGHLLYDTAAARRIGVAVLERKALRHGDLLLEASGGSPDQPVGRVARFSRDEAVHPVYCCSNFFKVLRVRNDVADTEYANALLQWVSQSPLIRPLQRQTTGIINLDFPRYLKLILDVPRLSEQKAIASALRQIDSQLVSLECELEQQLRLIAGLRTELLTPGEGWVTTTIGDVADVVGGGTPASGVAHFWGEDATWLTPGDVTATTGLTIGHSARGLTRAGLRASAAQLLPAGSVVVTSRATVGEARLAARELATKQGFQSLIPRRRVTGEYLLHWVLEHKADWIRYASGSTFLEIPRRLVEVLPVAFPTDEKTQNDISRVLKAADAIRASLSTRLRRATAPGSGAAGGSTPGAFAAMNAGLGFVDAVERDKVELPLIEQLKVMGWDHIEGDIYVPANSERASFGEVLLRNRMRAKLIEINRDDAGHPWLTPARAERAIAQLERSGKVNLVEINQELTDRLLRGVEVPKEPERGETYDPHVNFIDFVQPDRNEFLAINQFRVDRPGHTGYDIPDVVLFVNGIPVLVVECKRPDRKEPVAAAIEQLRRYGNQRDPSRREGIEKLFWTNQLTMVTSYDQARLGTFTAGARHYLRWRTTEPVTEAAVCSELGVSKLSQQQTLTAGVLRPEHLLDIIRHFVLWTEDDDGRLIKIGPRWQQFRSVNRTVERLITGKSRLDGVPQDERGGVVWQTQGSGKSLGMVFLARKLRSHPRLQGYKLVFVTDRRQLENQLAQTARLVGETLAVARPRFRIATGGRREAPLEDLLKEEVPSLVFATIQKYRGHDEPSSDTGDKELDDLLGDVPAPLNTSKRILVIVDEAHRSHTNSLNARLRAALPNAAHIGFTGTPILAEDKRKTTEIFGPLIDTYTLTESEADEATVPIRYEGRFTKALLEGATSLDEVFDGWFGDFSQEEREAVQKRFTRESHILEAEELIKVKARDMLVHYVDGVLPNGFKAMVVASSRLAAVRYQHALKDLMADLVAALSGDLEACGRWDSEFVERASQQRDQIGRLTAAAVISAAENDPPHGAPNDWLEWTDEAKTRARVEAFPESLEKDGLAFLCVKSMLLTGFDAPVAQVMYLDRSLQGAELLQAIARVNRTAKDKTQGLLVDYLGITDKLSEALAQYRNEPDAKGALRDLRDELSTLEARYRRLVGELEALSVSIGDEDACVDALVADPSGRGAFAEALKAFLTSLDETLPLPEALPYVSPSKHLGKIALRVRNLVHDDDLSLVLADAAPKVRLLIDAHVRAAGIDPAIPPVDITDAQFEREVEARKSPRAKAQVMEHAVRDYLTVMRQRDPARALRLSERLDTVLEQMRSRWDDLLEALHEIKDEAAEPPKEAPTGLKPGSEQPFYDLVVLRTAPAPADGDVDGNALAVTRAVLTLLRRDTEAVDFWRNPILQDQLRAQLVTVLDEYLDDYKVIRPLADELRALAHVLHTELHAVD